MTNIERKTIVIGIVFIATIIVSILGYEYLKGNNPFKADRYFYAVYDDVLGLNETAPVYVNGVPVGQISDISFIPGTGRVVVRFLVEQKDLKIPYGTIAEIYSTDMLGTKALRLKLGNGSQFYQPGDTIPSGTESQLTDLLGDKMADFDRILQNTREIIEKVNNLFSPQMQEDLRQTISHLRNTAYAVDTMFRTGSNLQTTLQALKQTVVDIQKQTGEINRIISNTRQITDSLKALQLGQSLARLDSALNQANLLLRNINEGQGTIGQLTVNDTLYRRLDSLVANLNSLLTTLRENPAKAIDLSIIKVEKHKK